MKTANLFPAALLALLLTLSFHLQAQTTFSRFVYFSSDEAVLDKTDCASIDSLQAVLDGMTEYSVEVLGHTDSDGSDAYNQRLAETRAEAVRDYWVEQGAGDEQVQVRWLGERKPIMENTTDQGKSRNRRVELRIAYYDIKSIDDLFEQSGLLGSEVHNIRPDRRNTIRTERGAKIRIPANSFALPEGTEASDVQIEVTEAFDYADCLANGLATKSGSRLLETGGMMQVLATIDGQELELAENARLDISYPDSEILPGMQLFVGSEQNGDVDWIPTSTPMRSEAEAKRTYRVAKDALLGIELIKAEMPVLSYKHPIKQPKPIGYAPRKPVEPDKSKIRLPSDNFLESVFRTRRSKDKELEKIYSKKMAAYEKRLAKYEQRMAEYEKKYPKYRADLDRWHRSLKQRNDSISDYYNRFKAFADYRSSEIALQKIVERDLDSLSMGTSLRALFRHYYNGVNFSVPEPKGLLKEAFGPEYKTTRGAWSINYQGGIEFVAIDGRQLKSVHENFNRVHDLMVEMDIENNVVDPAGLDNYFARVSDLGWINCDRFIEVPLAQRTDILLNKADIGTRYYLVFQERKSVIKASRLEGLRFRDVPIGSDTKIVAIRVEDGQPQLAIKEYTIKKNDRVGLVFHSVSMDEFKKAVRELG